MIISSCPTRISFSSCDHAPFDSMWGGAAINACINKRVYTIIRKRNKLEQVKYRISYSTTELCDSLEDIKHPLIRECIKFSRIEDPLEIIYVSDIPAALGLATSSSLVIALLKGLFYYKNTGISAEILFDYAYQIEREVLGFAGGWQDYACAFGGFNYLTGYRRNIKREPVTLEPAQIKDLESHCLLVYTGKQANSEEIIKEQLSLLKKGQTLEETLKIKTIVNEIHAALIAPDFKAMDLAAPVLESWQLKKQLSPSMTTTQIDDIEAIVLNVCPKAGIRLVGGGGGRGLLLVISPPEYHEKISGALQPLHTSTINFDMEGCKVFKLWS